MAFLAKVEELAPLIEASADESERSRWLAMPVVEAMSRAGSSRLWVPRSLGGAEADIATVVQVVEAVSRIDGAAGWCLTIAGNTSLPAGYLPSRASHAVPRVDTRCEQRDPGGRSGVQRRRVGFDLYPDPIGAVPA